MSDHSPHTPGRVIPPDHSPEPWARQPDMIPESSIKHFKQIIKEAKTEIVNGMSVEVLKEMVATHYSTTHRKEMSLVDHSPKQIRAGKKVRELMDDDDLYDVSFTYLIIPDDLDIETEYKKWRQWFLNNRSIKRTDINDDEWFAEWLIRKCGAK